MSTTASFTIMYTGCTYLLSLSTQDKTEQNQDQLMVVQAETPYFVRRKSKFLPAELQAAGEKAHQVDWKRSVLLNLVTQTTYSLTVSACTREHLQSAGGSQASSPSTVQVESPGGSPQQTVTLKPLLFLQCSMNPATNASNDAQSLLVFHMQWQPC